MASRWTTCSFCPARRCTAWCAAPLQGRAVAHRLQHLEWVRPAPQQKDMCQGTCEWEPVCWGEIVKVMPCGSISPAGLQPRGRHAPADRGGRHHRDALHRGAGCGAPRRYARQPRHRCAISAAHRAPSHRFCRSVELCARHLQQLQYFLPAQLQPILSGCPGRSPGNLTGRLQDFTLLWNAAGVVEQFAEKPGKGALQELTQGSKYSSETQPFEVTSDCCCATGTRPALPWPA